MRAPSSAALLQEYREVTRMITRLSELQVESGYEEHLRDAEIELTRALPEIQRRVGAALIGEAE